MTASHPTGVAQDLAPAPATGKLQGNLGVAGVAFMVLAAAAPLTVIGGNIPLGIGLGNGPGAPMGFVIASAVLLLFSIGFVAMTPHVSEAGAFFSYVSKGLGERAGMGIALVALITYTAIQVGIYGYMGWAVNDTVKTYGGPDIPWPVYAFLTLAVVACLGYRHINLSARVLGIALACEVLVVVAMSAMIFATGGAAGVNVESFKPSVFLHGSLGVAVLFGLTGFIGFEATAVFRDEAHDPARTIPRATYWSVLLLGSFYAVACWALVIAQGTDHIKEVANDTLAGKGNLLLDSAQAYLGMVGRDIVNVLLISSLFACVLSFHNVLARYQYVLSRKRLLPEALGRVHVRHESPHLSSIVQTLTAAVILAIFAALHLDPLVSVFGSMAGVATVGMVLLLSATSAAVYVFFSRHRELAGGRRFRSRIAPALAFVGLLGCAALVLSNFTLLTGGSVAVSLVLAALPFLALLVGMARGQHPLRP
ncbi:MAG: APC family permease [Acidovorax sp.]|nr:APC family permease [Acidovorax sp.]